MFQLPRRITNRKVRSDRGFTLLLAAVVSSVVLALGASIYLIARKEVALSSLGRDSQSAFYTADQAAECALYWDARAEYFGTTTPANLLPPNDPQCDGQHWTPAGGEGRPTQLPYYPYTITFQYSPTSAGVSYCANVSVIKTINAQDVIRTTIHADGFSTPCGTLSTNPRVLQRSVELHY